MKLLIMALALFWGAAAYATNIFYSELEQFHMDPLMGFSDVNFGYVQINLDKKVATFSLSQRFACNTLDRCTSPTEYTVRLPIVKIQKGSCGALRYTARLDQRDINATARELIITDNTKNKCLLDMQDRPETIIPIAPTEVSYATDSFNADKTFSKFTGSALKEIQILPAY